MFSVLNLIIVLLMTTNEHYAYIEYYLDTTRTIATSDTFLVKLNSYLFIIQRVYFGIQIIFYFTILIFLIKKFQKTILSHYSNLFNREILCIKYYKYLLVLPALLLLLMNSFGKQPYLDNENLMLILSLFFVAVLFFWGLYGNRQVQVIIEFEDYKNRGDLKITSLKQYDNKYYCQKIENLMIREELYLDNDLKIWDLSILLNIQEKDLLDILKTEYNQNFFTFINTYRVKKAKSIIEKHTYNSVQDIIDKSGFISLEEFFKIYKKIEKQKPDIV